MNCATNDGHLLLDIKAAVTNVAEKEEILKPTFTISENKKDKGALGNIYKVSLRDANNNKNIKLIVKKAPSDTSNLASEIINKTYINEHYFYRELWPIFQDLQQSFSKRTYFSAIPKCYFTIISDEEAHKIVLEDLTAKEFYTLERKSFFDKVHLEIVLKEYGNFHALSFFLKHKFPEKFLEFSKKFTNVFSMMKDVLVFTDSLKLIFKQCYELFRNDTDETLRRKLKEYLENGIEIYFKSLEYSEQNLVFIHGDCWSNNIMFKHNSFGQPTVVKFIDFQQMTAGTPVYDLSYCIYSGGTSDIFSELDYYINVYYKNLSDALKQFGLDAQSIYPFNELQSEWKLYSKFGYSMALLLLKNKLKYKDAENIELTEKDNVNLETYENGKYDKDLLNIRARDLVQHMYINDFL